MKLWIDDLREPANDWQWAQTSSQAITMLSLYAQAGKAYDEVSFDHDLGGDDTTRLVMNWFLAFGFWPAVIRVHTANPVGREWLVGTARRYAPVGTTVHD